MPKISLKYTVIGIIYSRWTKKDFVTSLTNKGASINYVSRILPIFGPPPPRQQAFAVPHISNFRNVTIF